MVEPLNHTDPSSYLQITQMKVPPFFQGNVSGSGGGSKKQKQRTAVEASDTLRSSALCKILDLICEGEIQGLVNGSQSIYLDETPIRNPDSSSNFTGVATYFRPGTQLQSLIPGIAERGSSEISIEVQVKKATGAISRTITNTAIDAVRVRIAIPSLQQYKTNGDLLGSSVRFQIATKTNNGTFVIRKDETITGKASSRYETEYYLSLTPPGPWTIKVERITPDSTSQNLQNDLIWAAYAEVIEAKFSYPNSALVGLTFDAEQFSSIPDRAYDIKGLKVKIPTNATVRADGSLTYSGAWNGTFKVAWTSDPAWCLYDLLTNSRYGAGIPSSQIDKWSFYPISQYCAELIPDGFGGTEPRFSLNCYIQTATEAYELISALASTLRGMVYWAEGGIALVQDAPTNPVRQFTTANVTKFEYSGSSKRSRHTIALVTWNDPSDFYRQKVEMVEDREGILLYGPRETRIAAFGCTSRGQAHRVGKWLLFSERIETDTVSFETGAEGIPVRPGEIILVGDTKRAGMRHWGRIKSASTTSIEIDFPVALNSGEAYELSVILTDGRLSSRRINNGTGSTSRLNTSTPFESIPLVGATWVLSSTTLVPQKFRVIGVSEAEPHRYRITGLVHYPTKYDAVERDLILEIPPTRGVPPIPPNPPRNVSAAPYFVTLASGQSVSVLRVSWEHPVLSNGNQDPYTVEYVAQIRRDVTEAWVGATTVSQGVDFPNIFAGYSYYVRVAAIDATGSRSAWVDLTSPIPTVVLTKTLVAQFNNSQNSAFLGGF